MNVGHEFVRPLNHDFGHEFGLRSSGLKLGHKFELYVTHFFLCRNYSKFYLGETPYQCKLCDRGFIQKVALQYHMSSTHEGDQNDCKICGKIFKSPEDLRNHLGVHTGI